MNLVAVLVIVVIVVLAVVIGLTLRDRSTDDGVKSFQRQIDALSPEARRPTVDKVRSAEQSDADGGDDEAEGA